MHTNAIKANFILSEVTHEQAVMKYADEADVLNIAMFGMTARQWREQNPDKKGNIRDYAKLFQVGRHLMVGHGDYMETPYRCNVL